MSNDTVLAVVTAENCPKAWEIYQSITPLADEGRRLQSELKMGSNPDEFGKMHIPGYEEMNPIEQMLHLAPALAKHHEDNKLKMLRVHRLKSIIEGDKAKMWIDIETTFGLDPAESQRIVDCGDYLEIHEGAED